MQDYSIAAQRRWHQQREASRRAARIAAAKPSWDKWRADRDHDEFVRRVALGDASPTPDLVAEYRRTHSQIGDITK